MFLVFPPFPLLCFFCPLRSYGLRRNSFWWQGRYCGKVFQKTFFSKSLPPIKDLENGPITKGHHSVLPPSLVLHQPKTNFQSFLLSYERLEERWRREGERKSLRSQQKIPQFRTFAAGFCFSSLCVFGELLFLFSTVCSRTLDLLPLGVICALKRQNWRLLRKLTF